MSDSAERTIRASDRRRREARQDGHCPHSPALVNGVQLLVVATLIHTLGEGLIVSLATFTKQSLMSATVELPAPEESFRRALDWGSNHLMSWFVALVAVAVFVNVAQLGGFRLLIHRVLPDFKRVDPGVGIGRLFSGQSFSTGIRALLTVLAVLGGLGLFWWTQLPKLIALTEFGKGQILVGIVRVSSTAAFLAATILVLFGAADYALSWWRFERGLMMTPDELKQDLRDTQGNPQTKTRRTEQARAIR